MAIADQSEARLASTDALLRYLSPEIEIIRIGLAESWRRGIRVVMRQ